MDHETGREAHQRLGELRRLALEVDASPARRACLPALRVHRQPRPTPPIPVVFEPVLYVVLQGAKQLLLDDRTVRYDESQLVIVTMNVPGLAQVLTASPQQPYLAVEVGFDSAMLAELISEFGVSITPAPQALSVQETPSEIYGPLERLLRLTEDPRAARLFAPSAVREMLYHVLAGSQAGALRLVARFHGPLTWVARVSEQMASHLDAPLSMPQLASEVGMSVNTLHRHFKAATGATPANYYRRLRLHEARRLAISDTLNVSEAATAVGYASPQHFARDYKTLFGESPLRDFHRLRHPQ